MSDIQVLQTWLRDECGIMRLESTGIAIEDFRRVVLADRARIATLESQAAALRGALEAVSRWWGESWDCSATPGHDGYPEQSIDAALATDAGASLLRIVAAAEAWRDSPDGVCGAEPWCSALIAAIDARRGKP